MKIITCEWVSPLARIGGDNMTIDEAIEGLEGEVREAEDEGALEAVAYLKLGIEALKRVKDTRKRSVYAIRAPLPGETKE